MLAPLKAHRYTFKGGKEIVMLSVCIYITVHHQTIIWFLWNFIVFITSILGLIFASQSSPYWDRWHSKRLISIEIETTFKSTWLFLIHMGNLWSSHNPFAELWQVSNFTFHSVIDPLGLISLLDVEVDIDNQSIQAYSSKIIVLLNNYLSNYEYTKY